MILIDDKTDINERIAYTILSAIQDIGGFASVVIAFFSYSFGLIQKFLFDQNLVSKLILINTNEDPLDESSGNLKVTPGKGAIQSF